MVRCPMDLALLFSQLIRLENIDLWKGLIHVGCNREVYADVLRVFCRELEKKIPVLAGFLEQENWKEYTAAMHAVKGTLGGIGAWKLAKRAEILEDASRKENYGFCREASGKALEEMEELAASLRSTALFAEEAEKEKSQVSRKHVSRDFLEEKLNDLYWLCSTGSSAEADALAGELKTVTYTTETDTLIAEVCTHVENLDYHLVLQLLGEQPFIQKPG